MATRPVKEMPRYEELQQALKDSTHNSDCPTCHRTNTKFEGFVNPSSNNFQLWYTCMYCDEGFIFLQEQRSNEARVEPPLMRAK